MAAVHLTKDNFNEEVLQSDKPVLVDFWAPWCGPCRMVSPIIDELSEELKDVKVAKVNVDEEKDLATQFNVMTIPNLIVFKEGKVVNNASGAMSKANIIKML